MHTYVKSSSPIGASHFKNVLLLTVIVANESQGAKHASYFQRNVLYISRICGMRHPSTRNHMK